MFAVADAGLRFAGRLCAFEGSTGADSHGSNSSGMSGADHGGAGHGGGGASNDPYDGSYGPQLTVPSQDGIADKVFDTVVGTPTPDRVANAFIGAVTAAIPFAGLMMAGVELARAMGFDVQEAEPTGGIAAGDAYAAAPAYPGALAPYNSPGPDPLTAPAATPESGLPSYMGTLTPAAGPYGGAAPPVAAPTAAVAAVGPAEPPATPYGPASASGAAAPPLWPVLMIAAAAILGAA